MKKFAFWIIVTILSFVIFSYFHPIEEQMACDKDFYCYIDQTFIGDIHNLKEFRLSKTSEIEYKKTISWYSRYQENLVYPVFNTLDGGKVKPFIYYSIKTNNEKLDADILMSTGDFNLYKQAPQYGYIIQSSASMLNYVIWLLYWIIFGLTAFVAIFYKLYVSKKK